MERWALAYLERYAASAAHLRRVLERRLLLGGFDPAAFGPALDRLGATLERSGLIDDRRYAEARALSLSRRGGSARAISARLAMAGIDRATIDRALAVRAAEAGAVDAARDQAAADPLRAERRAAVAHARRRRLGPFATVRAAGHAAGERAARRMRDLASMARAGFAPALCRAVIDAPTPADAEAWAEEG